MKQAMLMFLFSAIMNVSFAQDSTNVAAAVEKLRIAMINADSVSLTGLTHKNLSYGHSSGHLEDQQQFIHALTSGSSDFVTIDLTGQTVNVVNNTAIVRHTLSATTNDNGKPGTVKLAVLLVWVKEKGDWKLLARQAVHS